jgi:hypothetical protein
VDERSRIKIYVDEDAMSESLVVALRSRDIKVTTVSDSGLINKPDEEQLTYATGQGLVLYTFNVGDYCQLHQRWLNSGRNHAGTILTRQQRFSVGEQLRRIPLLRSAVTLKDMHNRIEFLSHWG